jgi:alkylation response protein AidB-like acyl-CoA dehydrogenase
MAIVNEAFSLSGSNAIYNASALQRRWRDVRAASQHLGASPETFGILGALELDQDVSPVATD